MTEDFYALPAWAMDVLAVPGGRPGLTLRGDRLLAPDGSEAGRVDQGVVRFGLPSGDCSIDFYNAVGGAHFHERSQVPLAMTTLDTPVYHSYLAKLRQGAETGTVVDVGGGDGRNAWPLLEWGHEKVIVVEPVFAALRRLRMRVVEQHPEWLDRLLLIEADARNLPLLENFADRVLSIEALAYLNENYSIGLAECSRVLKRSGRLLVADRDYEGGLVMQMLYFGGVQGLLKAGFGRDIWDGRPDMLVRSRCFTAQEFAEEFHKLDLSVVFSGGISAMSLFISYLRSRGDEGDVTAEDITVLHRLLSKLGETGAMRRSNVVIAEK